MGRFIGSIFTTMLLMVVNIPFTLLWGWVIFCYWAWFAPTWAPAIGYGEAIGLLFLIAVVKAAQSKPESDGRPLVEIAAEVFRHMIVRAFTAVSTLAVGWAWAHFI